MYDAEHIIEVNLEQLANAELPIVLHIGKSAVVKEVQLENA